MSNINANLAAAGDHEDHDHDHDHPKGPAKAPPPITVTRPPSTSGPGVSGPAPRGPEATEDGCPVSPRRLTDFANGEAYDFRSVVTYLTAPQCTAAAPQISRLAANGTNFSDKPPFRLDNFAKTISKSDLESAKRLDRSLKSTIPPLLRANPLSSTEMLPLLGQLSILSPSAARATMAELIEQELYAGDQSLLSASRESREIAASDIAKTLLKLGANEGAIASELADSIQDKAVLAQADALGKIFRSLAAAASVEAALVPTFNLSAGALNRGVQKGKLLYVAGDKAELTASVYQAIRAAIFGSAALEPGATELNEAMGALMNGTSLASTNLKKFWNDSIRILSQSSTQNALAEAVALSLTPEMIFLSPERMEALFACARNYPEIAVAIQNNFLLAWQKMWDNLHDGRIKPKAFNRMKERYFEPLVAQILELDPYLIDPNWLAEVQRRGMVPDEDVEKKFPRFVLAFLDRRDKATKLATTEVGVEPTLSSMAENFAVLWTLSNVHVPALMKWVKKYEQ